MSQLLQSNIANYLIAIISGTFITLSLAPFNLWALSILSCGLLFRILQKKTLLNSLIIGWMFGIGLFGSGASWVYVSIHDFGYTSDFLALMLTIIFCSLLAFFFAIHFCLFAYLNKNNNEKLFFSILLFGAVWVLSEYTRSYLFSGFPWLLLGYSQTESQLSSLAPIIGVYGISFIIVITGACLIFLNRNSLTINALMISFWVAPLFLSDITFTEVYGEPQKVSIVQPNISQHEKWDPKALKPSLRLYEELSKPNWEVSDLIIWPEAAIPLYYDLAAPYLEKIHSIAKKSKTHFLTGIPTREESNEGQTNKNFNSIISFGSSDGVYNKQKLVPFGEFIPFYNQLGGLLAFFDLPISTMSSGKPKQKPLQFNNWQTMPLICYEVVYPNFVANAAMSSNVLITISNDAWFGKSIGPHQHLQMAQMRALENQRYVLRGTGTGISAIISPNGKIMHESEQFQQTVITGNFSLLSGYTPWMKFGLWAIPLFCLIIIGFSFINKSTK